MMSRPLASFVAVRTSRQVFMTPHHLRDDRAYEALLDEAREALRRGDLDDAERHAREALQHDPERAAAYNVLALVFERRGLHPRAMDLLRAGLAVEPTDSATQENLRRLGTYPPGVRPLLGDEPPVGSPSAGSHKR
jgi:Tfp pilus assembly protein PilF